MNSQTECKNRFFIHTLGCKVNQYESEAMREILLRAGFKECLAKDIADIYIINTCTVTKRADSESRHLIGLFHRINPKAKIVVTGCYSEKSAEEISFLPGIAHILRNEEKGRIAEILDPSMKDHSVMFDMLQVSDFKGHTKAFVKIQNGCENACSYCKVPLVRGPLKSKPIDTIADEVKVLTSNGFKEVVLTGICLGAWGKDFFPHSLAMDAGLTGANLVDVLNAIIKIPGDFRIRLSSIELKYVTDELLDFISINKRVCRHLHIPLQSGDDEILEKMNRRYAVGEYRALIGKIRARVPDIAITTDVMVGFPGEAEAHFLNTVNFMKEIIFARAHIFTFSERKGTNAFGMAKLADSDELKKRFCMLNAVAASTSYIYRHKFLHSVMDILVETTRDKKTGDLVGYSDNYIKVSFGGPDNLMKDIVPVKITDVNLAQTIGEYVER